MPSGSPCITRKNELAKILQVSPRTVDNWMQKGLIPFLKINRVALFEPDEVIKALRQFERRPAH